jgi:hypothetical protein
VDLIGDVGDEPEIRPLDDDVIAGGKLVRDGVQTRRCLFPGERYLFLQFH